MSDHAIEWNAVEKEAVELLSRYIQINTINPPGNEIEGARFLQKVLATEGIPCEVFESDQGRGSLITQFSGSGSIPEIILLHHIDVVPVEEDKWEHPPLSGIVLKGEIWGRGALDCKSLGIMQLMAFVLLKRQGFSPEQRIVLAATADEEAGSVKGAEWLMQHVPEKLNARWVINEGGGLGLKTGQSNLHFCQVAEKGVCWVRITFQGKPGHGSLPHDRNCVVEMAKAIEALAEHRSPFIVTEPAEQFISGIAREQGYMPAAEFMKLLDPAQAEAVLAAIPEPVLQLVLNACLRNTFTPTVTKAGSKTNVIPGECFCEIDCRMLPGTTPEDMVMTIEQVLRAKGCRDFSIEILHSSIPTASATSTPLYRLFESTLKKHDPKAQLIPYMSSGATDSRFFRERGIVAYGMQMESSLTSMERMHGHNERIAIENLLLGIQVLYDTLQEFCK